VRYVQYWAGTENIRKTHLISLIGISTSKYYDWERRCGMKNNHNSPVPRWFWLEDWEKEAIASYHWEHPQEGYRRLTYMMIDEDVVCTSPSTVYRVLKEFGLIGRSRHRSSKKGTGFEQPLSAHEHWHIDVSRVNICGTFYYLSGLLDGYSRYVVHWEIREQMKETDVEIILQRALEKFPDERPRIISDNGPQFIARDFKEFIRLSGLTHVKTSPFYPQSNGKYERWNRSVKSECIRPKTPLSLEDARRVMANFVEHYNTKRLHSAIGYIAPLDKLEGREGLIKAERRRKLAAARKRRQENFACEESLTECQDKTIILSAGETEAGNAGKQPARDSRSKQATEGCMRAGKSTCPLLLQSDSVDASHALKKSAVSYPVYSLKSEEQNSISR